MPRSRARSPRATSAPCGPGLQALADAVRDGGEKLADEDLRPSDAIIPPEDLSLEEAQELLADEGFIPDLPWPDAEQVVLAARPQGEPKESDFELREAPDAAPGDGEVLVRNVFVSVDPYMRSRMTGVRTYVGPYEVGDPIDGGAVGRVVDSRHDGFAEGDWVLSRLGWCEQGVAAGDRLRKLDAALAPPSTALGVLGMPGLTAWVGLVDVGQIKEGETIYVSGAAGAVGSSAAQIAKLKGLRVIGSAGSAEKVDWLRSLGVEAFNYREQPAKEALADGIDVFFDNVGGEQLESALERAPPVRARDRLRGDLALQRRAPRARAAQPRLRRHEAAAHAGLHRVRSLRPVSRVHRRGRAVGGRRGSCSIARRCSRGSRTSRRRSPASSAATTRARCSCVSARLASATGRTKSITVDPRSGPPTIWKWQTSAGRRRDGDGAVPRRQAADPCRRSDVR